MGFNKFLLATCGAVALTACSMHPLPEDFAIDNSAAIVQKIRCETRDAITKEVGLTLANETGCTFFIYNEGSRPLKSIQFMVENGIVDLHSAGIHKWHDAITRADLC